MASSLDFSSRTSRIDFWLVFLANIIISIVINILDVIANISIVESLDMYLFGTLFSIANIIPGLALNVRRLHDTGKSGWLILIGLIPFVNIIGVFVLLYFYLQKGETAKNKYGVNPLKGQDSDNSQDSQDLEFEDIES